jgi:hypothetical protein
LVDKDSYALELSRYIHLNPLRAQIVDDPSDYRWSSYLDYIRKEKRWRWLQTDFILDQISSDKQKVRIRYQNFVEGAIGKDLRDPLENTVASTVLGPEQFVDWVRERWIDKGAPDRDVPALRGLASRPDPSMILEGVAKVFGKDTSLSRKSGLYLSHRLSGLPLAEIGQLFGGISPSGVTQNTRRFEEILRKNEKVRERIEELKKRYSE